jgi:hypothetical protein
MEKTFTATKKRKVSSSSSNSNAPKKKSKSNELSTINEEMKDFPPFVQIQAKFSLENVNFKKLKKKKKSKPFNLEEKLEKWLNSENNTFDLLSNPSLVSIKNGKVKLEKLTVEPQTKVSEPSKLNYIPEKNQTFNPIPPPTSQMNPNFHPNSGNFYASPRVMYQNTNPYKKIYSPLNGAPITNMSPIYKNTTLNVNNGGFTQYKPPQFYPKSPNVSPNQMNHFVSGMDISTPQNSPGNNAIYNYRTGMVNGNLGMKNGNFLMSPSAPKSPNSKLYSPIQRNNSPRPTTPKTNQPLVMNNFGVKYIFPSMYHQKPMYPTNTSVPYSPTPTVPIKSAEGNSFVTNLKQKTKKTTNEQMKKNIAIQRLEEFSSLEKKKFSKSILGRTDEEYTREIISPYSLKKLDFFIRRDFNLKVNQKSLLNELLTFHFNQFEDVSIDFCYLKSFQLDQVNQLIRRFYWNSIDVKDYLLSPENTVIVLYKRLVIGCGFIKNGYIPFIVVNPNWTGIEKYILYYLMKSSFRDGKRKKFKIRILLSHSNSI